MKQDLQTIAGAALQFLIGALISAGAFGLYIWSHGHPMYIENWIEVAQETFLLASAVLFMHAASRVKDSAGALWLIGGFFMTLFIRELDAWFDCIRHGCWKYVALLWLCALARIIGKKHLPTIIPGLAAFIRHRSYYLLLAGVVLLLVYSRLFGMKMVWELYAGGSNVDWKDVKSFSEEAMELLAYMIIFSSSALFWWEMKKSGWKLR